MRLFEIMLSETEKHVLFGLARKAKRGELEDYVFTMLNEKHLYLNELILLDAFELLQEGQVKTFERFFGPLKQEEKRFLWREAKKKQLHRKIEINSTPIEQKR